MSDLLNFLKDPEARRLMVQDLLDSANRGLVANTLGAPVDAALNVANLGVAGAGYLGHKTGLLREPLPLIDPQEAFGSSEWIGQQMQQRGIVSPNRNEIAEMGMAMLSPVAARGAGAVGRGVARADLAAAENAAKAGRAGPISVQRGAVKVSNNKTPSLYHGTEAEFEGPPSTKYGGAYYAEDPVVAEMYAGVQGSVKKANLSSKAKVFDATKPGSEKILKKIEDEYDNATDYKDPDDGSYMPLADWVKTGYLFKLGRKAQDEVMESIRAEGFDAVRYKDASPMTGDSVSWVVFDQSKIMQSKK